MEDVDRSVVKEQPQDLGASIIRYDALFISHTHLQLPEPLRDQNGILSVTGSHVVRQETHHEYIITEFAVIICVRHRI